MINNDRYPTETPSGVPIEYKSVNLAVIAERAIVRARIAANGFSPEELSDLFDPGIDVVLQGNESLRFGNAELFAKVAKKYGFI